MRDATCPGTVSNDAFTVSILPRPSLSFAPSAGQLASNGSVIAPPVCEGTFETAGVVVTGSPPLRIGYDVDERGQPSVARNLTVALEQASIVLRTDKAGHRTYTLRDVGDAIYPSGGQLLVDGQPTSSPLVLEHDVMPLPSVGFAPSSARTFCVGDRLEPTGSGDLTLKLEGAPPFAVELEVRRSDSAKPERLTFTDIRERLWPVRLPGSFEAPGTFELTVRHVRDANGCERRVERTAKEAMRRIEVAEIASIAPTQVQTDHCVGESLDFSLQGTAPWSISCAFVAP